ncbi:MAG: efflux RND transporter periplasmic adaptor subunit [Planctomycetia bacterium]|nr:efflux RND transporter periplasmic adaptor subunit [Planctomycetia bacterium]
MQPAAVGALEQATTLTGKITLNEDRVAHIFPLVEGRVDKVNVGLGDAVKKGQQMAVIQSREVGQAMLQLAQDRLQLSFAQRKDAWTQSVAANTQAMIELLRANAAVEEIETQLRNRPLGEYRDKLMTAYIEHATSRKNLDRLTPLQTNGIIASRQIFEAEANWTTARATLQSLLEQIEQDAKQAAVISAQTVQELQTRVAVDETALKILGFDEAAIATIDPKQGEALAHCPIHAPFDGTVISKDVALLEHVGPTNQILGVADMATVWLTADVYEEHLRLLKQVANQAVTFRSEAWPDRVFEARIFYTGDIVDSETRTISLRAVADNTDRMLKPGMFVTVELPAKAQATVLQVPLTAIQEHEGKSFVFVHGSGDTFERRDVKLGRRNPKVVEVLDGINAGDEIVVSGGFALKSQMLAALLAE